MESRHSLQARILTWMMAGAAPAALAITAAAQGAPDAFIRDHEHGQTALRFHRGHFHYALILDARPRVNVGRDLVTAGGRRIPLEWSGRSIWIDGTKFELPFGAVFLVSAKDSTPARQLGFNAMRDRLLLEQAAAAPAVAEWLRQNGAARDTVTAGAVQASTYPPTRWSSPSGRTTVCMR